MFIFRKISYNLLRMNNLTLLIVALALISFCTVTMYLLEPDNFETPFNTLYFVLTTFATVGYGDYSPVTDAGKIFTIFMYLSGIGVLGIIIGKIVDFFGNLKKKREEGKMSYHGVDHILIIGWSKKAEFAIKEILDSVLDKDVIIIDTLPKSPFTLEDTRLHYIQGDATSEETLAMANINHAKSVIIFADDRIQDSSLKDGKSLLITTTIERISPNVYTTVEIMTDKHIPNFSHVKVNEFILSDEMVSSMAVRSALSHGVTKIFTQLVSRQHGDDLYEINPFPEWKTYRDAFTVLLEKGATLIADGQKLDINRRLDEEVPKNATLFVVCNKETYQKLLRS
jgi:voltage-gated potassium channel